MSVSVPIEAIINGPEIQWNHIDGPLMHWAGLMHWLTWRERFRIFWFGLDEVDRIAHKRFPYLAATRAALNPESTPTPTEREV